jgi:hypothetical protein
MHLLSCNVSDANHACGQYNACGPVYGSLDNAGANEGFGKVDILVVTICTTAASALC